MRVSIPHIPKDILASASRATSATTESLETAVEKLANFLRPGNATVLTGAGVSVDSGIRAYRGEDGRYMNPNYRPIFYHELVEDSPKGEYFRKRYWARSYLGYPPVSRALANPSHYAISALHYSGHVSKLITQNVDGLHHQARPSSWSEVYAKERILELHGTLHTVHCRHGHILRRDTFQEILSAHNPSWKELLKRMERTGEQLRTNPDGDVELEGTSFDDFVIPHCETCVKQGKPNERMLKPSLTFFGDSVSPEIRDRSFRDIESSSRLLLIGTTLATFSAFRLFKHALELSKPILILNVGPTRADSYLATHQTLPIIGESDIEKIDYDASPVLKRVASLFLEERAKGDKELKRLLRSGVVTPIDGSAGAGAGGEGQVSADGGRVVSPESQQQ